MKLKSWFLMLTTVVLVGCFSSNVADKGELVGVKGRTHGAQADKPMGMVKIKAGSFTMGNAAYDPTAAQDAQLKTVTVASFYMDETEITNNEYREFVYWVRDSIFRARLAQKAEENGVSDDGGIGYYRFFTPKEDKNPYNDYMVRTYGTLNPNAPNGGRRIDWSKKIDWGRSQRDEYCVEVRDGMLLPIEERLSAQMEDMIDPSQLVYTYVETDPVSAARASQKMGKDYIKVLNVPVYPDTTVWVRDFIYSYNLPSMEKYFESPAYDDYPVVGVTWAQAMAFCHWRTMKKNTYQRSKKMPTVPSFRLPTEAEWEYAARGGIGQAQYPWGGPWMMDERGCFLANFKPLRGNYMADGICLTSPAKSFYPNNYGLYCMSGNVAEWTLSAYEPSSSAFVSSLNPTYSVSGNKTKVVKGGSWKDAALYLQIGARDSEQQDSARSYIGFRTVQDCP
ncbi:MAG: gliding motility lipoprotein GldK [Flavobacteriales bacterium]|nr:gliding motility lipoprotein GldK [Flavobacteriales bacterium]